jgi:hypothetical protein
MVDVTDLTSVPDCMAEKVICRPWITLRNGKRLYAWQKGLRAFCFPVEDEADEKETP